MNHQDPFELLVSLREGLIVQASLLANTSADPSDVAAELAGWVRDIEEVLRAAGHTVEPIRAVYGPSPKPLRITAGGGE